MSEHLDYDALRADTVRQVAKLMAASAITAPKSGGQLFKQGKHLFIETVIVDVLGERLTYYERSEAGPGGAPPPGREQKRGIRFTSTLVDVSGQ
jgi:hypothetical protein